MTTKKASNRNNKGNGLEQSVYGWYFVRDCFGCEETNY
jgi:hypothetical protein